MTKEKIYAKNPKPGTQGVNIDRDKYDAMKKAILKAVGRSKQGVPFKELREKVAPLLPAAIYGGSSVSWYLTVVKLDLEARGVVERVPGVSPQRVRRV